MNIALGLINPDVEPVDAQEVQAAQPASNDYDDMISNLMTFPGNCSECNMPAETRMQVLDIPHFKEAVLMSTTCDVSMKEGIPSTSLPSPLRNQMSHQQFLQTSDRFTDNYYY